MGRSIHEYGPDLGNKLLEHRLEISSKGFNQESNAGEVSIWDIDYSKPSHPTKMVDIEYSLQQGKTKVESVTSWRTVCPSTETDDGFLGRIGEQLDKMTQERQELS